MMKGLIYSIFFVILFFNELSARNFYDFKSKDLNGNKVSFEKFRGKVLLVVNTASRCGYTYQYQALQELHQKYSKKGFLVIGFPSNDFGAQEPGSDNQIKEFCKLNYGVEFPMMSKSSVTGEDKSQLYQFLTSNSFPKGEVRWNFEKFLIDKNGKVVKRFRSSVEPDSELILTSIEELL